MALCAGVLSTAPAKAASLNGPVSGWEVGTEPSWVSMYEYVPDNLAPNPPILVVVHYCSGNAFGVFKQAQDGGMVAAAEQYGFIMLLPQTTQNCWDVATTPSLTHDGGGDTGAIVHQVQYEIATYGANPDRVYVTGTSSGAMVTQAMMAVYPDVFKGGAAFAGVPAGCWSVNDLDGQWSSPCAGGEVTHTAQEWGDMARNMYPGYSGFRPRLQLWHGDADSTLSFVNQTEAVKQWTNVLGLDPTPTMTTTETIGDGQYTRQQWLDGCGITILDVWTQPGGPHGTDANMNGEYTIPFFDLDQTDAVDPQAAGCMDSPAATGSGDTGGGGPVAAPGGATPSDVALTQAADVPSRPSCACDLARSQRRGTALPWASAFAWVAILGLVFGRRRRPQHPRRRGCQTRSALAADLEPSFCRSATTR
jgi:poly(hydroxyalkanoate) depolymerase family esterase